MELNLEIALQNALEKINIKNKDIIIYKTLLLQCQAELEEKKSIIESIEKGTNEKDQTGSNK